MKLALCQTPITASLEENQSVMRDYVRRAAAQGAQVVCLPEMWPCQYDNEAFPKYAEPEGGETWQCLQRAARESGVWLVGGSVPERAGERLYNTCYVFSPEGEPIAKHRKVHLFDIDVPGGQRFMESDTFTPGDSLTVFDTPWGRIGVAICFDIRFAEWYRMMALEGAKLILAPGAFNMTTGPAHWELSIRMRAVDNQCFVAGCAPARDEGASYVSYGNSLLSDPWGTVLGRLSAEAGLLVQDIDLARADAVRNQIPILSGKRHDLYTLQYQQKD
ncbi:MAG: carbon-nitrogen hydrolase family protein [Oscillospiraceae bacterium]|nr:carbon-nitrogen hydrolase family protein [Oscillospiraceae bacterium]